MVVGGVVMVVVRMVTVVIVVMEAIMVVVMAVIIMVEVVVVVVVGLSLMQSWVRLAGKVSCRDQWPLSEDTRDTQVVEPSWVPLVGFHQVCPKGDCILWGIVGYLGKEGPFHRISACVR